jgi:DNA-binding NtrC family response regulator
VSYPDQSTSVDPKVVDVLTPVHISCLGVPMLADLLSEAALRDASLKLRLRELLSTANKAKDQFEKPAQAIVPELSLGDHPSGASPALGFVFDTICRYAISRAPVLITGESGAARELAARAIHGRSVSKNGPFIAISCAPKQTMAIGHELFGCEKNVSARGGIRKIGRLEMAAGGSIFLDSIDNLPLEAQGRLLRFLQEGTIERIGSREPISVATRVIVATHVDLRRAVANHQFRGDLLDCLDGLRINLPTPQCQGNDILLMAIFLLQQVAEKTCREKLDLSAETELGPAEGSLGLTLVTQQNVTSISPDLAGTRANVEAALIRATLKRNRYNIKQSAKEMGISRVTLYRAIHKYGIAVERLRAGAMVPDVVGACHPFPLSPLIPPAR